MKRIMNKWQTIPKTIKVSSAYAICSIIQRCLSFITLPIFARLLTTEQYGQVTIFQSWEGIISLFLTLNLAYGSFSTAMVKYQDDRDGYVSSIEGVCIALSLVFILIYFPFRHLWNKLFELPTYIICMMVLEILGTTSILFWNGKKRFEYKYKAVVTVTLLISVLSPILQYILVSTNAEKGYAKIIGGVIVNVCIGSIFFFVNIIKGKKLFNKEYWKYAFGFNVPLIAYYLSQSIFNQSDRIMISHMVSKEKAAIYGVSYNLAMVLMFVISAINNSYLPWLYTQYKEGKPGQNKKIGNYIAILMACMILLVIWFAPEFIYIMAGEQYFEARWIVPPVAMSLFTYVYVTYSTNFEFYFEDKNALVRASIGSAILNVILNAIFIPNVGYIAAGYTTLVSYIMFAIYNYYEMKKISIKKEFSDGYDWKSLIFIYAFFSIAAILGMCLYNYPILRFSTLIILALILLLYRKKLVQVVNKIREGLHER